jgi:hypothetical protein
MQSVTNALEKESNYSGTTAPGTPSLPGQTKPKK